MEDMCLDGGMAATANHRSGAEPPIAGAGGAGDWRVLRLCEWRGGRGCGPVPRVKEEGHE